MLWQLNNYRDKNALGANPSFYGVSTSADAEVKAAGNVTEESFLQANDEQDALKFIY